MLSQNRKRFIFAPETHLNNDVTEDEDATEVVELCNNYVEEYLLYVDEHIGTSSAAGEVWSVLFATEIVFDGFLLAATRYHVVVEFAPLYQRYIWLGNRLQVTSNPMFLTLRKFPGNDHYTLEKFIVQIKNRRDSILCLCACNIRCYFMR